MPKVVCNGAKMRCSFGSASASLKVTSNQTVKAAGSLVATIADHVQMSNILPFGDCKAPAMTKGGPPVPCAPITPTPWTTQATSIQVQGKRPLDPSSLTMCAYAGVITIQDPNSDREHVP